MGLTITEALAEIKTIAARVEKKRRTICEYSARSSMLKDPLEDSGGSKQFVAKERQAIADLEQRMVKIRVLIQKANLENELTLHGETAPVAEWLTYRREVASGQKAFLQQLQAGLRQVRDQFKRGPSGSTQGPPQSMGELVVNIDEAAIMREEERVTHVLGDLDGKLSLFNARTEIDI